MSEPSIEQPTNETLPDTPEGFSFTQICEQLGFDPALISAITVTPERVVAVSTEFIEPVEATYGN